MITRTAGKNHRSVRNSLDRRSASKHFKEDYSSADYLSDSGSVARGSPLKHYERENLSSGQEDSEFFYNDKSVVTKRS